MNRPSSLLIVSVALFGCSAAPPKVAAPPAHAAAHATTEAKDDGDEPAPEEPAEEGAVAGEAVESTPADGTRDPHVARQKALEEASEAGILGLLGNGGGDGSLVDLLNAPDGQGLLLGQAGSGGLGGLGVSGGVVGGVPGGSVGTLRISNNRSRRDEETVARERTTPPAPPKRLAPPTRIAVLSVVATGIATDAVSGSFDRGDRSMRECYEALLARDPRAEGTLVLEISIGKDGRATSSTKVSGTPADPDFAKCVSKVVGDLRFSSGVEAKSRVTLGLHLPPS